MALPGTTFNKTNGALGFARDVDGLAAILWWMTGSSLARTQVYSLQELKDAATNASVTLPVNLVYAVNLFYLRNPGAPLQVQIYDQSADTLQASVLQAFQENFKKTSVYPKLTLIGGEYIDGADITAESDALTALGTAYASLEANDIPTEYLLAPDQANGSDYVSSTSPLSTQSFTLSESTNGVSYIIGGDADAEDEANNSIDVTYAGALLGDLSRLPVHQSAARSDNGYAGIDNLHISGLDITSFSQANLDALDDESVLFLTRRFGRPEAFWNGEWTLTDRTTDDYSRITRNRVWHKAQRLINETAVFWYEREVEIQPNTGGKMTPTQEAEFLNSFREVLDRMVRQGNISGDLTKSDKERGYTITLDPNYNATTGQVTMTVQLVPLGILRSFTVNLGYTL